MNLLKEVLNHQVFPAMGCTEPVAAALCAAHAAKALGEEVKSAVFTLDQGTYKNGMGVNIPNTGGLKGNLLAGTLGLIVAEPELEMEVLKSVGKKDLAKAKKMISDGAVKIAVAARKNEIYIEVRAYGKKNRSRCIISGSHTEVSLLEKNSAAIIRCRQSKKSPAAYKNFLRKCKIKDLLRIADRAGKDELAYIKKGVEMNLSAAREGMKLKKVGYYLMDLKRRGYLTNDVFTRAKIDVACATDARMDGAAIPVMSSGESGNQGIVASLGPYSFGKCFKIREEKILKSIALSHLINSYVKLFTGGLSPVCGCAIAAGAGAAGAIVYQLKGKDARAVSLAINNLVSDLGGMLCDGAKSGCALKVVSSTDSAIRSAYMAAHRYGITEVEGFVGKTAEETIKNLANISTLGMSKVDPMIVDIMLAKQKSRRK